ncbi:hypothetical protein ABZ801_12955 [Actinomadura sp. NPDC047616]|uniref:hypothetical protein n=1 Tax=Actinomadura sp. NPDC047616 TaxID=3155914 RepID=UPI0033DE935D
MRRRMLASLALLPVLALGPAACGDGGEDAVSSSRKEQAADLDKMRQYARCMRENGVDMDDPDPNGGMRARVTKEDGKGAEVMKNAEAKCRRLLPDGGKPKKPSAEELAKMRALAKCMREHGINMPDPESDGKVVIGHKQGDPGPTPGSAEWQKAQKECDKYAPKRGSGGGKVSGRKTTP